MLLLFREIVVVYVEIYVIKMTTLCKKNAEFSMLNQVIYIYIW
jgi:hypothetical protein